MDRAMITCLRMSRCRLRRKALMSQGNGFSGNSLRTSEYGEGFL